MSLLGRVNSRKLSYCDAAALILTPSLTKNKIKTKLPSRRHDGKPEFSDSTPPAAENETDKAECIEVTPKHNISRSQNEESTLDFFFF